MAGRPITDRRPSTPVNPRPDLLRASAQLSTQARRALGFPIPHADVTRQ